MNFKVNMAICALMLAVSHVGQSVYNHKHTSNRWTGKVDRTEIKQNGASGLMSTGSGRPPVAHYGELAIQLPKLMADNRSMYLGPKVWASQAPTRASQPDTTARKPVILVGNVAVLCVSKMVEDRYNNLASGKLH